MSLYSLLWIVAMTTTCLFMMFKSGLTDSLAWLAAEFVKMAERRQRLRRRLWDLPYPEEQEQRCPDGAEG